MFQTSTNMSGKQEGIPSLNTSPNVNPFCQLMAKNKKTICSECYSIRMLNTFRQNSDPKFKRNGEILSSIEIPLNLQPIVNASFFRIGAHGELINDLHFKNIVNFALKNPHTIFGLWTKRKDIINRYVKSGLEIPQNIVLIFSNPQVNKILNVVPKNFNKVFNVVTSESPEAESVNCGGKKCIECLTCYRKGINDIVIERIKTHGSHMEKKYKKEKLEKTLTHDSLIYAQKRSQ